MGNTGGSAPEETRAEARRLFEAERWSLRRIAEHLGVNHGTLSRWSRSKSDPWDNPNPTKRERVPDDTELAEAEARATRASLAARNRWAIKRADVADAAGIAASEALEAIKENVKGGKAADAQKLAVVFGILVDKATLLAGEPGARTTRGEEPNGPAVERLTDPAAMAAAGAQRALALVRPAVIEADSTER